MLSTVQECARHSPSVLVLSDLYMFYRVTRSPANEPIWEWTMHTVFNRLLSFNKNIIIIGLWEPSFESVVSSSASYLEENPSQIPLISNISDSLPPFLETIFRTAGGKEDHSAVIELDYPDKNARSLYYRSLCGKHGC